MISFLKSFGEYNDSSELRETKGHGVFLESEKKC